MKEVSRQRRWQKENPDKAKCHSIFHSAVASGKVVRPPVCSRCGVPCVPHGHHSNYAEPLLVVWLCPPCHGKEHDRERPTIVGQKPKPTKPTIKRGVAWDADLLPRLVKLARKQTFSRLVNDLCRKQIEREAV